MKTLIFLLILISMLPIGCSLFQSKEELLTKEKWVLYARFISKYSNGKSESKMIFYKKSDEELVLTFEKDGTVRITEKDGGKVATINWKWKSDDKKYLTLNTGYGTADFHILKLNMTKFEWSKSNIFSDSSTLEIFRHLDDSEWDDSIVDEMNK